MAWSTDTARPLTDAFDGALGAPGTVIAVACIDEAETVIEVNPEPTPADGRFEVGSVTKTMTATLLALLAADGSLRLDDEVGRWLQAGANAGMTVRQLATHTSERLDLPWRDRTRTSASRPVSRSAAGGQTAGSWPTTLLVKDGFIEVSNPLRRESFRKRKLKLSPANTFVPGAGANSAPGDSA